jgi:hypothetical protein
MADGDRWKYPEISSLDFDPQAFSDWSRTQRDAWRIDQLERLRSKVGQSPKAHCEHLLTALDRQRFWIAID